MDFDSLKTAVSQEAQKPKPGIIYPGRDCYVAPDNVDDDKAPGPLAARRAAILGWDKAGRAIYKDGFDPSQEPLRPVSFSFEVSSRQLVRIKSEQGNEKRLLANEITVTLSVSLYKPSSMTAAIARSMLGALRNQGGNFSSYGQVAAGSSVASNAALIPLGGLTPATNSNGGVAGAPHYAWFFNDDLANTLRIVDANQGSSIIAELAAQDVGLIPLYGNCKPAVYCPIASTPILEFFIMGY